MMFVNMIWRFDLDENAFSPPSHDDSFFYIRYPKGKEQTIPEKREGFQNISDVLRNASGDAKVVTAANVDFSKHPKPCQEFIQGSSSKTVPQKTPQGISKSNGTDDGFKDLGCGSSIVKVAQKIVAQKVPEKGFPRGNTIHTMDYEEDPTAAASSFDFNRRRGSKSLPASPMGSPKSQRRAPNPYFTGTFSIQNASNSENPNRGWILAGLLGQRQDGFHGSQQAIQEGEENHDDHSRSNDKNLNKITQSIENINLFGDDSDKGKSSLLKAKPSELREMNFWSPTSM